MRWNGLNCKTPIMIGDRHVKVAGALSVSFDKEYAVKKLFFFCNEFKKSLLDFRTEVYKVSPLCRKFDQS